MIRGRKALSPAEKFGPELGRLTHEAAADEAAGKALDVAALAQAGLLVGAGRIQTATMFAKLGRVVAAKEFIRIRESKNYKGLPYKDESGNLRRVVDLEEFCEAFIGRSYQSCVEDAHNLNSLGDEMYEQALVLGLTTRNFREIRLLPQDDQALVKEAIAAKNRETVIEILEAALAKHAKEKRAMQKEITGLKGDLDANQRVTAKKNQKIDTLEALLHHRQVDLPAQIQELQIDCAKSAGEAINTIQKFTQIRLATMDLLKGNDQEAVLGAIGVTHLTTLWQVQAWLTEEMQLAEQIFGGTRMQVRTENERGPDLSDDDITNLKNAGAAEVGRVAGPRVAEVLSKGHNDN